MKKETTKTSIKEYDKDGKLIKHTETEITIEYLADSGEISEEKQKNIIDKLKNTSLPHPILNLPQLNYPYYTLTTTPKTTDNINTITCGSRINNHEHTVDAKKFIEGLKKSIKR